MLVTHSGRFHADEIFAIAMITLLGPQTITRSRDMAVIQQAKIVLDVGAEYDPAHLRFDHHQNSFTETRADGIPFATAGLVWRHYAEQIFKHLGLKDVSEIEFATQWVDQKIIRDIDAVDNGWFNDDPRPSISQVIGMMNASSTDDEEQQTAAFYKAIDFTQGILVNYLKAAMKEAEVFTELSKLLETNLQDGILILDKNLPFKDFIRSYPDVQRVVYPKGDEGYGVYCNGTDNHLPERFRGLRADELNPITGLTDAVFCHKSGFMAVCKSFESALFMAKSQ